MDKPKSVVVAVNLLWGTLLLGLIHVFVTGFPSSQHSLGPAFQIVVFSITAAIMALFYVKISAGRNWARITFAVMFVLGLPVMIFVLPKLLQNPVRGVFLLLQTGLQMYALFLIFTKPGSEWFK